MEKLLDEFLKRGINVIFHPLIKDVSGILKYQDGLWFCIINDLKPKTHQRFTLAHELGHYDLHRHLANLFADYDLNNQLERQANLYAAQLLMPKEEVLDSLPDLYDPREVLSNVERLACKFDVSFEAMVRRLVDLKALRRDWGAWLLSGAVLSDGDGLSSLNPPPFRLPPAPIISFDEDPPFDQEFRYPGDPPYWVRLRERPPKGARSLVQGIEVAGISFEGAYENAISFLYGKARSLSLRCDPLNPYDPNALEVIGHWVDAQGKERSGLLGYVPRTLAARIAEEHLQSKLSPSLDTFLFPWRNRSPGIRFSLWVCS